MRFSILGGLEVVGDDGSITLGGNRQRAVLAILLLERNQRVSTDAVIERIWGEQRPRRARNAVQRFVADLRASLHDADASRIVTVDGGYRLRIDDGELDADAFEDAVRRGRTQLAAGAYEDAAATLRGALAMWRGGSVLGDLGAEEFARPDAVRLEELRIAAEEDLIEAELDAGRHRDVVGRTESLLADHPFRERLWRHLVLAHYRSGRQADALRAFQDARRRLADELGIEPSAELTALHERILRQDPTLLPDAAAAGPVRVDVRNPYKGLEAFGEQDADDFFGREDLVEDLAHRLADERFVAVVGPSGSGKSSVIRAGLIPHLRRCRPSGLVAVTHPGAHPFEELEAAVCHAIGEPALRLAEELAADETGLRRAVKRVVAGPGSELLLVVDQFEELFTLTGDEARGARFVASLLAALDDPGCPIRIVVALRADFYDRPIRYRRLGALVSGQAVTVLPLADDELERVITEPAAALGVRFAPRLVAEMLADVRDQPAALPLLQYALTELFDERDSDVIGLDDYDAVGGVPGALTRRADQIFAGLDETGRAAARQLFLRLVSFTEGHEVTRRRVSRRDLGSLGPSEAMDAAIDAFGRYRLLAFDRDPVSGEPTVEVAHEALLDQWTRLARWIDESREDLRTERRLAAAADDWVDAGRDDSFLLVGSRLTQVASWAETTDVALADREREFLDASVARRRAEEEAEAARRARELELERRSVRRLRALAAALAVGVLAAVALSAFAFAQRQQAEARAREVAIQGLTAAALADLEVDPERSVLLAIEAAELSLEVGDPVPFAVQAVLHRGLGAFRIERSFDAGQVAAFSPDGARIVTGAADGTAQVWDADDLELLHDLRGHDQAVHAAAFSPDGARIATASADGTARIWDAETGFFLTALDHPGSVSDLAWSADGTMLLSGSQSSAFVWSPETGEQLRRVAVTPRGRTDVLVSWFPGGDRFVALSDGAGAVFDLADGTARSRHATIALCAVAVAPDGDGFAWSDLDGAIRLVALEPTFPGVFERTLVGHEGPACALAVDDTRLVSGGGDGKAIVWDATFATPLVTIPGHRAPVESVAFHPDQTVLLTATADGVVRLSDSRLETSREWATLNASVVSAAPGTSNSLVTLSESEVTRWDVRRGSATVADTWETTAVPPHGLPFVVDVSARGDVAFPASDTGNVRVITAAGGDVTLTEHDAAVHFLRFDATGDRLLTVDTGGQARTWHVATQRVLARFTVDSGVTQAGVWTQGGTAVVVRSGPSAFSVRDAETGTELRSVSSAEPAKGLAVSPEGPLAIGGDGGAVTLVDVDTGELVRSFDSETGVWGLAFSADGTRLAAGGADGSIVIRDVASGETQLTLGPLRTRIQRVGFSDDGDLLTAVTSDGEVAIYVLDPVLLLDVARSRVTRDLTSEECRTCLGTPNCPDRG